MQIVEPADVPSEAPRDAPEAERSRSKVFCPQFGRQRQRSLRPIERLGESTGDHPIGGARGVAVRELRPVGLDLEDLDRLREPAPRAGRVALLPQHRRQPVERGTLGEVIAGRSGALDRFLVQLLRLLQPTGVEGDGGLPGEEPRPIRMVVGEQLQGALEAMRRAATSRLMARSPASTQ